MNWAGFNLKNEGIIEKYLVREKLFKGTRKRIRDLHRVFSIKSRIEDTFDDTIRLETIVVCIW